MVIVIIGFMVTIINIIIIIIIQVLKKMEMVDKDQVITLMKMGQTLGIRMMMIVVRAVPR